MTGHDSQCCFSSSTKGVKGKGKQPEEKFGCGRWGWGLSRGEMKKLLVIKWLVNLYWKEEGIGVLLS